MKLTAMISQLEELGLVPQGTVEYIEDDPEILIETGPQLLPNSKYAWSLDFTSDAEKITAGAIIPIGRKHG